MITNTHVYTEIHIIHQTSKCVQQECTAHCWEVEGRARERMLFRKVGADITHSINTHTII